MKISIKPVFIIFILLNIIYSKSIVAQENNFMQNNEAKVLDLTFRLIEFQQIKPVSASNIGHLYLLPVNYILPIPATSFAPFRTENTLKLLNTQKYNANNTLAYTSLLNNKFDSRNNKSEMPYWKELGLGYGIEILSCIGTIFIR